MLSYFSKNNPVFGVLFRKNSKTPLLDIVGEIQSAVKSTIEWKLPIGK